jgi:hypothetical protein
MRLLRSTGVVIVIAALTFVFVPKAGANEWDQKTILTFNQPVEVPGAVLSPGTYVLKVLDVMGTRDVIQVLNKDENRVYATFTSLPEYTDKPFDKTFIRFAERPMGSPVAIEAWFYPGRRDGHEFIYPMQLTSELYARANY